MGSCIPLTCQQTETQMILIAHTQNTRTYFTNEYDTAMAFYHFYDGELTYCDGGYKITI